MIIVICNKDENNNLICSHGINIETDEIIIIPQISPKELGARFNTELGEYII